MRWSFGRWEGREGYDGGLLVTAAFRRREGKGILEVLQGDWQQLANVSNLSPLLDCYVSFALII